MLHVAAWKLCTVQKKAGAIVSLINTQHGTFKLKLCCAERTGLLCWTHRLRMYSCICTHRKLSLLQAQTQSQDAKDSKFNWNSCQGWRKSRTRLHQCALGWAWTQELNTTRLQVVDTALDLHLSCGDLHHGIIPACRSVTGKVWKWAATSAVRAIVVERSDGAMMCESY